MKVLLTCLTALIVCGLLTYSTKLATFPHDIAVLGGLALAVISITGGYRCVKHIWR